METFELDGIHFVLDYRPLAQREKSERNKFVLVKTKRMLEFYESLARTFTAKNILEIGMFEGGSLVYLDKIFAPTRLVGIDARRTPIAPLEQYIESHPHIKTYYGRQQDAQPTRGAAQSNFPDGIDLVIDDASHLYDKTTATFLNLFPLVKPGGLYVIEDWSWAHTAPHQRPDAVWGDKAALTNLVFNLVVMTAVSRVVDSVTVKENVVCISKGRGVLPPSKLDLGSHLRGRELALI
jgi:predicted O-methyltransferase YrrM